jgi:hypothetical protein
VAIAAIALGVLAAAADGARWNWSGSVVVDYKKILDVPDEEPLAKVGVIVEPSVKATVDVSDRITFHGRVCMACHGLTVDQAYGELRLHSLVNFEAGRINVPFGDFYLRHDPAADPFLSKPLPYAMGHMLRFQSDRFNLGAIPIPYVDHGASLYGDHWIRDALQIWYAAYAVNGFKSTLARDFAFKTQLGDAGFSDNNNELAWGTRVALALGPLTAGGSYLRGAYDPDSDYDYDIWGIDASAYWRGLQLRAEYVVRGTEVLEEETRAMLRKKAFYAQLEAPAGRHLELVGRFDGLLREGPPLGTENDASSALLRWTAGINVMPTINHALRFQYEHWRFTDFVNSDALRLGLVVSY